METKGKQFNSSYQPRKNGRKPSQLKKYIKETEVSLSDLKLIFKSVIFAKSESELMSILANKEEPMVVRILVRAYLEDFKKGKIDNTERLFDRIYGKADQPITGEFITSNMTPEEREERIKQLNEKREIK